MIVRVNPKFVVTQNGSTINVYHANRGEGLPKHNHSYSHLTFCHAGRVKITKENVQVELTKDSQPVNLKEIEWHELEAMEDNTVFVNIFVEGKY
jgi:quercetin dioxygenase-like cupin family protein